MSKVFDFDINKDIESSEKIKQIEDKCLNNSMLTEDEIKSLLGNLSYEVRKRIADYEGKDMDDYLYPYKCDLAQSMIYYYLNDLGIKVNPVNTNEVFNGVTGHSIVLASFDTLEGEKTYLVDPTYIQFFSKENCDASKFTIINNKVCIAPDPGFFVVEENKENVVLPLLENGFIEFTDDVSLVYGDSFYRTRQGAEVEEIRNHFASGSMYRKFLLSYTSNLSKTRDELTNMNLIDTSKSSNKGRRR